MIQSTAQWAVYRSKTIDDENMADNIDLERLDKLYSENKAMGDEIKHLITIKNDLRTIRADLADYCFNLIQIAYPEHPILSDTSTIQENPIEFSDLFWILEDSVDLKNTSGSSSSSDSIVGSSSVRITKNPAKILYNHADVKTEPPSNEYRSTPMGSPDHEI